MTADDQLPWGASGHAWMWVQVNYCTCCSREGPRTAPSNELRLMQLLNAHRVLMC